MGVIVYWLVVLDVLALGGVMQQQGKKKKYYIAAMTAVHTFVCGCRYMYLTGDLRNYAADYYAYQTLGWFDPQVYQEGRNAGFLWLMKLVSVVTHGNFQIFLMLLAVVTEIILAVLIYRYSPRPWLSYLVWNCMAFYVVYGFTTIKQGLAMAILMCAMMCIFERNVIGFVVFVLIAGFVHVPALCFLPAYWLSRQKINFSTIMVYTAAAGVIFLLRSRIVDYVRELYYEGNDEIQFVLTTGNLGGRFAFIVMLLAVGFVLKGFQDKDFECVFNLVVMAAVLQMFSGFDNVFTRLADYYFQFAVLYIPMIFYTSGREEVRGKYIQKPILPLNRRSTALVVTMVVAALLWWYNRTCLGVTITYAPDDYTKFRFMWEAVEESTTFIPLG